MTNGGVERRRVARGKPGSGTRLKCVAPAAPGEPPGTDLAQRVVDLNKMGACVLMDKPLAQGSLVQVEVQFPELRSRMMVQATVRWSRPHGEVGSGAHLTGVEFDAPIMVPAARESEGPVVGIIHSLRVAVAKLRLYPKESPQVLSVAQETFQALRAFLDVEGTLTLSKTSKGLLANGQPLPGKGAALESMQASTLALLDEAQVGSISFRKGLTVEELVTFLHALTKKFWDVKEGKDINKRLREEQILQITVDEVQYVAIGAGDIVITDAASKLTGGHTRLAELLKSLDETIEASRDDGSVSEIRLQIMKKLLDQDPGLMARASTPQAAGAAVPEGQGDGRISLSAAQHAVSEVVRLLGRAPKEMEHALRNLGKTLADAFRHEPHLAGLMGALLGESVPLEVLPAPPSPVVRVTPVVSAAPPAPEKRAVPVPEAFVPPAVKRSEQIQAMPGEDHVAALVKEGPSLLAELSDLGRKDLVKVHLVRLIGDLPDRLARRRVAAAKAILGLRATMERFAGEVTLSILDQAVPETLEQERDASVYEPLAELMGFLVEQRLKRGDLVRAREGMALMRRHWESKEPVFPKRGEMAYVALEKMAAGPGFGVLGERIRSGDPEVLKIVETLGPAAVQVMVREIKFADSTARRALYAQFIARAGATAASIYVDEMRKAQSPADVLRMLEMLPMAAPPEIAEVTLEGLLKHAAGAVRRRAATLLGEQAYPGAGRILMDALEGEQEAGLRMFVVESLGRLRYKDAYDVITGLVDSKAQAEEVRCAACVALGHLGDVRAIPLLARLCVQERGITKILRQVPPMIRAAAVKGLGAFRDHPEAHEAVRRCVDDKDANVRTAAHQARMAPLLDAFGEPARAALKLGNADELKAETPVAVGDLADVSLEELLEKVGGIEKSGLLALSSAGASGRFYFDSGLLICGEFDGKRDLAAIQAAGIRTQGFFMFQAGVPSPERRVLLPVQKILNLLRAK